MANSSSFSSSSLEEADVVMNGTGQESAASASVPGTSARDGRNVACNGDDTAQSGQDTVAEVSPAPFEGRFRRFNEVIGRGAQKVIYKAQDTESGAMVAWNAISLTDLTDEEQLRAVEEAQLLSRLQHPRLINCHASWRSKDQIVLITQLVQAGSLKKYVQTHEVSMKQLRKIARQILEGLQHLHKQNPPIVHRDIKCENILYSADTGELVIGDLGLSTQLTTRGHNRGSFTGTPHFMAPELYDEEYDETVDVYSFGLTLLEMCTRGEIPYAECTNHAQIYRKLVQNVLPEALDQVREESFCGYIRYCILKRDDGTRPSASDALAHPFIQQEEIENDDCTELVTRNRLRSSDDTLEKLPSHISFDSSHVSGLHRRSASQTHEREGGETTESDDDDTWSQQDEDVENGFGLASSVRKSSRPGTRRRRASREEDYSRQTRMAKLYQGVPGSISAPLQPVQNSSDPADEFLLPASSDSILSPKRPERQGKGRGSSVCRSFSSIHEVRTNISMNALPQSDTRDADSAMVEEGSPTISPRGSHWELKTAAETAGMAAAFMDSARMRNPAVVRLCLLIEYQPEDEVGTKRAKVNFDYDTCCPPEETAEEIVNRLIEAQNVIIDASAKDMFAAFLNTFRFGPSVTIHSSGVPKWRWRSITFGPRECITKAIECRNNRSYASEADFNADIAFNTAAYAATVATQALMDRVPRRRRPAHSLASVDHGDEGTDNASAPTDMYSRKENESVEMQSAGTNASEDSSDAEDEVDSADESHVPAPSGDASSHSPPLPIDAAESESDAEETTDEVSQSSTHGGKSTALQDSPQSHSRRKIDTSQNKSLIGTLNFSSGTETNGRVYHSHQEANGSGDAATAQTRNTLNLHSKQHSGNFNVPKLDRSACHAETVSSGMPEAVVEETSYARDTEVYAATVGTTSEPSSNALNIAAGVPKKPPARPGPDPGASTSNVSTSTPNVADSATTAGRPVTSQAVSMTNGGVRQNGASYSTHESSGNGASGLSPSGGRRTTVSTGAGISKGHNATESGSSPRDDYKRRKMQQLASESENHSEPGGHNSGRARTGSSGALSMSINEDPKQCSLSNTETAFSWTPDELSLIGEGNIAGPTLKPAQPVKQSLNKVPSQSNLAAANNQRTSPSFLPRPSGEPSGSLSPRSQLGVRAHSEGYQASGQGPGLAGLGYTSSPVVRPAFRFASDNTRVNTGVMVSAPPGTGSMETLRPTTLQSVDGMHLTAASEGPNPSYFSQVSGAKKRCGEDYCH
eukprot:gb/GECG01000592.1/.p1 GENE.gb/GECG01000592.1/~~gb/GECG01000592.1/.p1  ORF type:complete len:1265 (+),score=182.90 gb/GECG01000592.1/:1-3795(+)